MAENHRTSKKIAHELFDACNAFKEDSKQWQRIAVAIQAAEEEIERLTRELAVQKGVNDLAYIPHRALVESRDGLQKRYDKVEAERDRLRALLRDAARQIRSDSGPCPVDMTSRVGLLLTRIDLQLKDSSDETKHEHGAAHGTEQAVEVASKAGNSAEWSAPVAVKTVEPDGPAIQSATNLDEGKLWSFLRDVMTTGCAIETDTRALGRRYEEHSARLDAAARDAVPQFFKRLGFPEKAPGDLT